MTPYQIHQMHTYGNILLSAGIKVKAVNVQMIVGNCIFQRNGITVHQHADGFTISDGTTTITQLNYPTLDAMQLRRTLSEFKSGSDEHIELENGSDLMGMLIQEQIEANCNHQYNY